MNGEIGINSTHIEAGDLLVGFSEKGFRSIGLTVAHESFEWAFGADWQDEVIPIGSQSHKLGELALKPPTDYAEAITDMNCGYDVINIPKAEIKKAAEITSGGIPKQLSEMLKETGLGAEIVDPFEPPEIAILAQALHPERISDEEAYHTWCFGHGMIIVASEPDADEAVDIAAYHGVSAKIIGYVTQHPDIHILSRGTCRPDEMLSFEA